ncbi:MAG: hypothetical protein U1E06_02155 [Tabrizicola sp.]|uniref:hypothetical protein n=1 Tax=Tabrizicola sp. TaxID=2005166 RepID=UPI00273671E4|nr:hypothetical protein [Tabrizicola sp.]MDP3262927.1 hypothetical protein [Tabrizicola sp.]MDP3649124.1 hypothetical protein [Paracoccaceae bacterium]MDZ4065649.1 hypothetical protein [Tabrizicola sp.]
MIAQHKTGQEVSIPIHPNLRAALDALRRDNLTFIMSERGKPMTPEGFTNWFRKLVEGVVDDQGKRRCLTVFRPMDFAKRRAAVSQKPGAAPMRSWRSAGIKP